MLPLGNRPVFKCASYLLSLLLIAGCGNNSGIQPDLKAIDRERVLKAAEFFLNEAEVALVPGSAFGAPGYMRLSYATSMDKLVEALKRIKAVLGTD